jgi:hypothetical protein
MRRGDAPFGYAAPGDETMWLITTAGFFSIVEKPWDRQPGTLTVRARAREDLEALKAGSLPELGDIKEDADADYRFRAQAPREAVARALAAETRAIDYDNFKSAVAARHGAGRASVYHDVWEALYSIQRPSP